MQDQRGQIDTSAAPSDASLGDTALELIRASARFTRMVARVPGITYSSVAWRVLADLAEQGPTRVSDLAAQQRVAQPTMTTLVNRLASEEWVDRQPDPEDGRATLVLITPAGEEALNNYRHAMAQRLVPQLVELSDGDREALSRAAHLMLQLSEQV